MAEAWGDEDEVVDEWGTEDESVEAAAPPTSTPSPTPDTGEAPQTARPSWNMFGQRMDYPEPGTPGAKVAAGAFAEGAEALAGVPELIATLGSTIAAEPISGLAGLYTELSPGTAPGSGADTARAVQEAMTIWPQSRYGQKAIGAVGNALEPLGEAFTGIETFLGDAAYEATESPGMAAAATVIPTPRRRMPLVNRSLNIVAAAFCCMSGGMRFIMSLNVDTSPFVNFCTPLANLLMKL